MGLWHRIYGLETNLSSGQGELVVWVCSGMHVIASVIFSLVRFHSYVCASFLRCRVGDMSVGTDSFCTHAC